eukprot:TRINITY_DN16475_c0_g1_i1.p1 TRINITY_DN16475_c0_g1~~TRINITY_DN16475_c0_g1_i1.p1  ORF type:complete len:281 (-),score=87.26 TRINITY_DN16475_c0_g1_i1:214-1056(-)
MAPFALGDAFVPAADPAVQRAAAAAPFASNEPFSKETFGCAERRGAKLERALARRQTQTFGSAANMICGVRSCGALPGVESADAEQRSQKLQGKRESYKEALAAQIEEKRVRRLGEKRQHLVDDKSDDARVERERAQFMQHRAAESDRQRQREATVAAREDSLSQFLAERSGAGAGGRAGPSGAAATAAAAAATAADALEARRRAVPGLCDAEAAPRCGAPAADAGGDGGRAHAEPPKRTSSNVWANGANQNCGNFLSDKPTSRVLRPPGGGSSLQLGGW